MPNTNTIPERRAVHQHFVNEITAAFIAIDEAARNPTMQIVIRRMRADDLDRVTAILAGWNMAPIPASVTLPDPEVPAIPVDTTFVALVNGMIAGVASYVLAGNDRGQTLVLAVDRAHRKIGIGARLQSARLAEMKAKGITSVRTETDRPEAIEWYVQKFGCRVVGSKPKKHPFSLEGVDHWTVLELDLRTWRPES